MSAFADLHRPGDPLVLPNAWDHASAAALAEAGFAAVGTTSLGVAAALGLRDGAAETAEATIDLAHRLTHLPVPVTMDIENGFSTDPAEVAAYVDRLGPVAGVNLEDQLADPASLRPGARRRHRPRHLHQRARRHLLARRRWRRRDARARQGLHRRRRGRDLRPRRQGRGRDRAARRGAPGPAQRALPPGALTVPRLAELGVARISTGSLLYRVALGAALDAAAAVRDGRTDFRAPSYATVDALAAPKET